MIKQIFKNEYIFLDTEAKSQEEVFAFIAQHASDQKLVTDPKALISGFFNREAEGSTGFEEGFAIPHARIKAVKQAAVFVIRLKTGIDWKSIDGLPTKNIIALLVPDGPSGEEHLSILSELALKLMNQEFKDKFAKVRTKREMLALLQTKTDATTLEAPQDVPAELMASTKKLNVLAITACVVGIAHTYMAEERLIQTAQKLGYNIRTEAQGSRAVKRPFTANEIEEADLVIFATDIGIDKSRFVGKKFYHTSVAKAIKQPETVFREAIELGTPLSGDKNFEVSKGAMKRQKEGVMNHILAGISYMIPVIVLGGICLAFSLGLAKAIWGPDATPAGPKGSTAYQYGPLNALNIIGSAAFTLMIPILGGFIANSLGGRAAIAPAMVGAFIGNNPANFMPIGGLSIETPMGFVGAIIAGLAVGYFVRWTNTWNVPKALAPAMPIFFIPLVAGIIISVIFIYVLGGPIGWVMRQISSGIENAYKGNVGVGVGLLLGALLGAMAGFDMGGPVNKIAFVTCTLLIGSGLYQPMGALAAAIPVAPLSMGLSTLIFKRFFNEDERNLGIAALIMGVIGISEGAIPFAIRDPRRAIISNVLGSMVAGAIAGALGVTDAAAHGGPIVAILGAVPYGLMTLYFFIAIIAGTAVTTGVYGGWMLLEAGQLNSVRAARTEVILQLQEAKNEKTLELKNQIKELKATNREHDKDEEILKLKAEIQQIKNQFKSEKSWVKSVAKEAEIKERGALKANRAVIRKTWQELRQNQKETLALSKQENLPKEELGKIKQVNREHLNKIASDYRAPFVLEFRKEVDNNLKNRAY